MSALLKDRYSHEFVDALAWAVAEAWPSFDRLGYVQTALDDGWAQLELKQRMRRLSSTLHQFLPMPYARQIAALEKVAPRFNDFTALLFPDFVEQFGLDDFDVSVRALELFTRYSSSEMAVRSFILRYERHMMAVMERWAAHENEHVRRLASEGCRPRLPWAMALPAFKKDPSPVLPILEALQDDPSEYVRRSVANNLNDISKDHPQIVLDMAKRWYGRSAATDRLIKHALRTLLKKGEPRALKLFGFHGDAPATVKKLRASPDRLRIGERLSFSFSVSHRSKRPLRLRLEYAVDFVKASGRTSRKVFQISEAEFAPRKPKLIERTHRFCDFTTRKHHPGSHRLTILVNGIAAAEVTVELLKAGKGGPSIARP